MNIETAIKNIAMQAGHKVETMKQEGDVLNVSLIRKPKNKGTGLGFRRTQRIIGSWGDLDTLKTALQDANG